MANSFSQRQYWRFLYKSSPGSQDATRGPWPRYYFVSKGERAEYGFVCVSSPGSKGPPVLSHGDEDPLVCLI